MYICQYCHEIPSQKGCSHTQRGTFGECTICHAQTTVIWCQRVDNEPGLFLVKEEPIT